nr:integrase, catalytic region, zinc finger, CCHC-type, peptidase aspartic, catalytic [Tanacetum cinerariifolium]
MEAANILTSGVAVVNVSLVAGISTVGVPTVSGLFPTASAIFTTASVVTPYTRQPRGISAKDKGKEKVVESERESEQLARYSEIARLHAEEELKMMIEGLDRSNEVIVKHLQEYEQAEAELTVGERIELINELVKYQDHHAKILKYQAQQSKLLSKKEQREFYMSVLRSHAGWKTKHFKGMTLEEIKEKLKQLEDIVPMSSKEKGERVKRKGLKLDQWSDKRMKTSEDVSKEDLKGMMQLVPLEEVFVEALQVWTLVKETLSIRPVTKDKEKELWVELKRLFEPDFEDSYGLTIKLSCMILWNGRDRSQLKNFIKKFTGTVRFRNNHFGAIMGYGDYVIGDSVISRVYYVEGLGHNLFSVRQFCDSDLEVAFRKHSCYVRDSDGVELIKGSRGSNLYTISVKDMMKSSPICLLSKASKTKWFYGEENYTKRLTLYLRYQSYKDGKVRSMFP